jgi:hypothetical protein
MQTTIDAYFPTFDQLPEFFVEFFKDTYMMSERRAKAIVDNHLRPELDKIKNDVYVLVEFPYVDKMYRNTFYHYYSSKLKSFPRDTARISFFDKKVDQKTFYDPEQARALKDFYLGFIIIRPTFPKIIGRSSLSPAILKEKNFLCCTCPMHVTAQHIKFKVDAFPHASQDGQFITCAETTIWSVIEYFSNRYPDYKPVLPSTIHDLFKRFSFKRQLPSEGMTAEQIAYVIREAGFGAIVNSHTRQGDEFYPVVSTFIESGIPVIGVLTNSQKKGHALNIIGRECEDPEHLASSTSFIKSADDFQLIDFHNVDRNFVFIDDNHPPYQIAPLKQPGKNYKQKEWQDAKLAAIIVPLYHRIYLDAIRARKNFIYAIKKITWLTIPQSPLILRIFLASSRSYKEYIMLNKELDQVTKQSVTQLVMPKFIWVAELSSPQSYRSQLINGVLLQDATEPSESTDQSELEDTPVFGGWFGTNFFSNYAHVFKSVHIFDAPFLKYRGNLQELTSHDGKKVQK